jgi:two-component system chemotaxis response regulator CheB
MSADPYRVMVVDDSAVIRGLLARTLEADSGIRVVSSVGDGQMALNAIQRQPIDVVVLDIEMPVMDGLTALPKLIAASPHTKVIMASTLTKRNAEISLKALSAGAADYVTKPSATRDIHGADSFKRELVDKVKVLAVQARRSRGPRPQHGVVRQWPGGESGVSRPPAERPKLALRDLPVPFRPDVIAIGSSTGGPQALFGLLGHLSGSITQPILITQHMPATFTMILAEHITRQCGLRAGEARDGEALIGGRVYVAPGNYHMTVDRTSTGPVVRLNQDPPENYCRPSVDVMMRSVAAAYGGRRVLAVILTGMGQDGLKGCQPVAEAGGVVVAQDEASSVVWGMPGAVANAGICNAVMPLLEIGPFVRKLALRSAA